MRIEKSSKKLDNYFGGLIFSFLVVWRAARQRERERKGGRWYETRKRKEETQKEVTHGLVRNDRNEIYSKVDMDGTKR